MKENWSFRRNKIRFVTTLDLIKCLKQIKYQRLLLTCTPISKLLKYPIRSSLYFYLCLTNSLSLSLSLFLSLCVFICVSFYFSLSLSISLTRCVSISLSFSLYVCVSIDLTLSLSLFLYIYSPFPSLCLHLSMFVPPLYFSVLTSLYLSLTLSSLYLFLSHTH